MYNATLPNDSAALPKRHCVCTYGPLWPAPGSAGCRRAYAYSRHGMGTAQVLRAVPTSLQLTLSSSSPAYSFDVF